MPSPFPGMNPYLEQDEVWHDFHERFMPAVSEVLVPLVRPHYIVKLDEHLYIHELSADERRHGGRGDITVARGGIETGGTGGTKSSAPAYGRLPQTVDVEGQSFIEIRDRRNRELITVIELLSPSNKRAGPDREQYLNKRRQILASPVHLVEIDLLRGGPRLPVEELPACAYYVAVSRAEERPAVGIWPLQLRDPLPEVPVPLRAPDGDARFNLQKVIHHIHDTAGYSDYVYEGRPQPPLDTADAAWADALVPRIV